MRTVEQVKSQFQTITDISPDQKGALTAIDNQFNQLVGKVYEIVPLSADRDVAVQKLLEAKLVFAQSITHDWNTSKSVR